jgi:hypothetical protein
MNEQLRLRKMVDGRGRADQVAIWDGADTLTGTEDLTVDERGRLRNLKKPVVTEAPQDGKTYGRRNAEWKEVRGGGSVFVGGGSGTGDGDGGGDGTQGPPGPQGPQGPTGPEGPQGPEGPPGADGIDGTDGTDGATGATGPQGPAGNTGATGATGATGPQGDPGPTGATGATGPAGADGADGADFPDAPNDGLQYARQSLGWSEVVHQSYGSVLNYMFNATTAAPPAAGGIRFNNTTQTAVTTIWLNYVTNDVNAINLKNYFLQRVKIGDTLYAQDKDAPTKWQLYEITGAFTDNSTYATIPVTWRAGASAITAARVIISREGASVNSPIGEAPNDGVHYSRRNLDWAPSWVKLTQAAYDALSPPDANTLYIVVG